MNPFASLLDPAAHMPKPTPPSRVHTLLRPADDLPVEDEPVRRGPGRPKGSTSGNPQANLETRIMKAAPAKPAALAWPEKVSMTYGEAMRLRDRVRAGQPVDEADLIEANRVVQSVRHSLSVEPT